MKNADVIVVGGGMIGAAVAYGLGKLGRSVIVLDEGDSAWRAARGNFGLVWLQGKGLGMPPYMGWTRESVRLWPELASDLFEQTGVDVAYEHAGGLELCLGEEELEQRRRTVARLVHDAGPEGYDCEILGRNTLQDDLFAGIELGPDVSGGSFCPHDGHVNPLYLLRALHTAFSACSVRYLSNHHTRRIELNGGVFTVETEAGTFQCEKLVLAAGHGITNLGPGLGLEAPIRPERGQILVTERARARLPLMSGIRQTREGSIMLGGSNEAVGFDDRTTLDVTQRIAHRAVRIIPALARLQVIRTWAALRVLAKDQFPIYQQSGTAPGAYLLTSHSGVTLTPMHAGPIARWIAEDDRPPTLEHFGLARFEPKGARAESTVPA